MALTRPVPVNRPGEPIDDYQVDRGPTPVAPPPPSYQAMRVVGGLLFIFMVAVSLALFWLIGILIGLL